MNSKRPMFCLFVLVAAALCAAPSASAAIPLYVNHQGLVSVNGVPFSGSGFFKLGFYSDADDLWLWTNDGTRIGDPIANPPDTALTLPVTNGVYHVTLGATPTPAVSSSVFEASDVKLRIWFNDGTNGELLLGPDIEFTSVAYAFHSRRADLAYATPGALDGGIISNDGIDATNFLSISELWCSDDTNQHSFHVPAIRKTVQSTWTEGDGNGALDNGTIGASNRILYIWAIGDSTGVKDGDIVFSDSASAPVGWPGSYAGYDIKRLIGGRQWTGSAWQTFQTSGRGRTKKVWVKGNVVVGPALDHGATFIPVDANDVVPIGTSNEIDVHISIIDATDEECGLSILIGAWSHRLLSVQATEQSVAGELEIRGTGTILLDDSGEFYAATNGGSTVQVRLKSYVEDL